MLSQSKKQSAGIGRYMKDIMSGLAKANTSKSPPRRREFAMRNQYEASPEYSPVLSSS